MLEPFRSLFSLRWTNQPYLAPLPTHITRTFIPVSKEDESKRLEFLVCEPRSAKLRPSEKSRCLPILFVHGGFGSAAMYADFMTHLSSRYDAPTHAVSLRGHGASYSVPYFRMVYLTGLDELVSDLSLAVEHITNVAQSQSQNQSQNQLDPDPGLIIVGHSSGGGLAQYALANQCLPENTISGIVLLDAIPNFGNLSVYANWAKHDPWFGLRMSLTHFNHVASPLSSDGLVIKAFFGSQFEKINFEQQQQQQQKVLTGNVGTDDLNLERDISHDDVTASISKRSSSNSSSSSSSSSSSESMISTFRSLMTPYESLLWPLAMMRGWWSWLTGKGGRWLSAKSVLLALKRSRDDDISLHGGDDESNSQTNATAINTVTTSSTTRTRIRTKRRTTQSEKICIIIGSEDKLMDMRNQQRMAEEYRDAMREIAYLYDGDELLVETSSSSSSKIQVDQRREEEQEPATLKVTATDGIKVSVQSGVRFVVVHGAGHHVHNDIGWEKAADQIRTFALNVG